MSLESFTHGPTMKQIFPHLLLWRIATLHEGLILHSRCLASVCAIKHWFQDHVLARIPLMLSFITVTLH